MDGIIFIIITGSSSRAEQTHKQGAKAGRQKQYLCPSDLYIYIDSRQKVPPILVEGLSPSVNSSKKYPHRSAWRCVLGPRFN